jgi:broad specificity phosphatase PhoE
MSSLRRLVLVRHGETVANSGERLIGSGDPSLSAHGRDQMHRARAALVGQVVDLVVSSPARRAFQAATVLTGGASIRLEPDFREIHFGRWEGRSLAEIESADPVLFQHWRDLTPDFEYPGGEVRAVFHARVQRGLDRVLATNALGALLVIHKGVIRAIVLSLTGQLPEREHPGLGEAIVLTRAHDGRWMLGGHSSNPAGVPLAAPVSVARG